MAESRVDQMFGRGAMVNQGFGAHSSLGDYHIGHLSQHTAENCQGALAVGALIQNSANHFQSLDPPFVEMLWCRPLPRGPRPLTAVLQAEILIMNMPSLHRVSDAGLTALALFDLRRISRGGLLSRVLRPPKVHSEVVLVRQPELRAALHLRGRDERHARLLPVPGLTEFGVTCASW